MGRIWRVEGDGWWRGRGMWMCYELDMRFGLYMSSWTFLVSASVDCERRSEALVWFGQCGQTSINSIWSSLIASIAYAMPRLDIIRIVLAAELKFNTSIIEVLRLNLIRHFLFII